MKATNFTRNACTLGDKERSYESLQRDYRCGICGNRLVTKRTDGDERYQEDWHIECARCGETDFVHERKARELRDKASKTLASLPKELVEAYYKSEKENRNAH